MGGNIKSEVSTAQGIRDQQLGMASEQSKRASDDYALFKRLISPLIKRDTALAEGNREEALAAAMPVISKLSAGWAGAKQNILNNMPAGAARDRALADLETQRYTNMAGAQAELVREAPVNLAGTGGQVGNFSLQETGSALAGFGGAAQSNADVMKAKIEQRKALLNFFSQMAGVGAGIATGGIFRGGGAPKPAGGGGTPGFYGSSLTSI